MCERERNDASMEPLKPKLVGSLREAGLSSPEHGSANAYGPGPASRATPAQWLDARQFSFAVLLMLTAAAFYAAYLIFSPFLTAMFLAFVLAIAFAPLHQWVTRRIRSATTAALVTTTVVMLCIVVPFILVSLRLVAEAASFYSSLSQQWRTGTAWYTSVSGLSEAAQRAAERTGIPVQQLKSGVGSLAQQFGAWLVGMTRWAARGAVQQMITAILVFLILFFFLRDRKEFRRGIFGMLPLPPRRVLELTAIIHENIVANIYGMFAVGLIQGILTALGFWATGLRAPLLWGVMAMVFSFVPLVGPILVWMPGAAVLAMQGDMSKAVGLFAWGAIVISAADYIIRPRVAGGGSNKTNRLLILLSFLGGVKAFGVIGIFVGPVVLALIIALLRILREERVGRQKPANLAA
jgi:predicted PurR-regulated permease PerM